MSDLTAGINRVRDCSRELQRTYDEFTAHADPVDDYSQVELGDSRIVGAFYSFGSNWKIHREQLAGQIRTLGVATEDAARSQLHDWPIDGLKEVIVIDKQGNVLHLYP